MILAFLKKIISFFFSSSPHNHVIPFGPNKGLSIYTTFYISPRMYFGIDEPWIAQLIKKYCKEGEVVYDIGAHIGYTSLLFAQRVTSSGSVHAFEILPTVANRFLIQTVKLNNLKQVHVHAVGLTDSEETLKLRTGKTMMARIDSDFNQGETVICQTVKLDDYVIKYNLPLPSLMKIDIERSEICCILGAYQLLQKKHPLLIIEFHGLDLLKQGYEILTSLGYKIITKNKTVDLQFINKQKSFYGNTFCYYSLD